MLALSPSRGEGTVQLISLGPAASKEVSLVEYGEGKEGLLPLQGCALLVGSPTVP